jgi:hypothetical protein
LKKAGDAASGLICLCAGVAVGTDGVVGSAAMATRSEIGAALAASLDANPADILKTNTKSTKDGVDSKGKSNLSLRENNMNTHR